MSLVLCDVTPNQILFLGDSARPTENTNPLDYTNDAKKVLHSPDRRIGIGLAGTLNLCWENIYTQPFKWIENFLNQASPDQTKNPEVLVRALKGQIEALRGMPFNDRGIIMVGGFFNARPQVFELEIKSKSIAVTDLQVSVTQLNDLSTPHVWSFQPTWNDLLSLSGVSAGQIPTESDARHKYLRDIVEKSIRRLTGDGERKVAEPIVSISILKPPIAILGWGSLLSKPEGDASIGQKPLRIADKFVPGGPSLPIEFSRISKDGRLTLVIDPAHGTPCDSFYAISAMPDLTAAIQNLAEREGTSTVNIHFAVNYETYTDEIRSRIAAWLIEKRFDAAVWTGLPPKFQFQGFLEFSTDAAINYLKSLTGETRDKAFNYINTAPPTVKTPVREAMIKQSLLVATGNKQPTKIPELTPEERALIAVLEPIIRKSVWSGGAKVFEGPYESSGKWIEYPLRHPDKKDDWGKHHRITLTKDSPSEDFTRTYCAFGANDLHTSVAVYRILRHLKQRGLLKIPGFESKDF